MTASLPSKLALGLVLLSAILMATLYSVHKTPSFQTNLPNWMTDTPTGMGLGYSNEVNVKGRNRREMKAVEQTMVEEEEEETEEERGPMNIILFYADDWRHDVGQC
jgi:hypothetical protein